MILRWTSTTPAHPRLFAWEQPREAAGIWRGSVVVYFAVNQAGQQKEQAKMQPCL